MPRDILESYSVQNQKRDRILRQLLMLNLHFQVTARQFEDVKFYVPQFWLRSVVVFEMFRKILLKIGSFDV